jgi:hypothetical protein
MAAKVSHIEKRATLKSNYAEKRLRLERLHLERLRLERLR